MMARLRLARAATLGTMAALLGTTLAVVPAAGQPVPEVVDCLAERGYPGWPEETDPQEPGLQEAIRECAAANLPRPEATDVDADGVPGADPLTDADLLSEGQLRFGDYDVQAFTSSLEPVFRLDDQQWCILMTNGTTAFESPSARAQAGCRDRLDQAFGAGQVVVPSSTLPVLEGLVGGVPTPAASEDRLALTGKSPTQAELTQPFTLSGGAYRLTFAPGNRCTLGGFNNWLLTDAGGGAFVADGLGSGAIVVDPGEYRAEVTTIDCRGGNWRLVIEPVAPAETGAEGVAGAPTALAGVFVLDDEAYCAYAIGRKVKGYAARDRNAALERCVERSGALGQASLALLPSSAMAAVYAALLAGGTAHADR